MGALLASRCRSPLGVLGKSLWLLIFSRASNVVMRRPNLTAALVTSVASACARSFAYFLAAFVPPHMLGSSQLPGSPGFGCIREVRKGFADAGTGWLDLSGSKPKVCCCPLLLFLHRGSPPPPSVRPYGLALIKLGI